jgi:hypothetical protein
MRLTFTPLAKGETAMLKTAIIASAVIFGAAAPAANLADTDPATADQTVLNLPEADAVIAQFSYLEISHGADGFGLSITDKTAVFIDFEFPGEFHIRIGF